MLIELRPLSEIKPYDKNPRKNDQAVEVVAASLREFGWRQPIVLDKDGVIVVGHTRYKAAQHLGLDKVPVHIASELTPEQAKAYRIADNQTASIAEWDMQLLPIEIADLKDLDFDLSLLGFDDAELAEITAPLANPGLVDPDEIPAPPDAATTKRGDIIILGNHRLMCGDSGSVEDLDRLLDGQSIHMVNTDPPYNVSVAPRTTTAFAAGDARGLPHPDQAKAARNWNLKSPAEREAKPLKKMRPRDRALLNDFVSDDAFEKMLLAWFGNISRVLLPGRAFWIWGGYANVANYPPALKASGLYFSQTVIWDKQHPVLTRKDMMGAHEWCQPSDTAVLTPDGHVPIASLRDGDRVLSFRSQDSALTSRRGSVEVRRAERWYSGPMLRVSAGARQTWCTPGHIWSVKLAPHAENMWCVYLMRRGRWWRIGKSKLISSAGFGVKHRIKTERGDAAWLLSIHGSNLEATVFEQVAQAKYGIPTTTWAETYQSRRTLTDVARLYEALDLDTLQDGALRALADHGRDLTYPFIELIGCRPKLGRRVPATVRACNLLPEIMLAPVPANERPGDVPWLPIDSVSHETFEGKVYSLDVPVHHHYIADGMVTHNCFYGWHEGAAHQWHGPNNVPDLWHVKKVNPQSMIHLTEKPVELAARAMAYSSKPGENVLDLFGGSGSTLIAAEQQGRRAFLMELDPLYCDVIVQRYEAFSGKKAERVPATTPTKQTPPPSTVKAKGKENVS